jgi:hypothetical protein
VHSNGRALATSGDTPYGVTYVTDTNPDPNIVETILIAEEATVDIGGGEPAYGRLLFLVDTTTNEPCPPKIPAATRDHFAQRESAHR